MSLGLALIGKDRQSRPISAVMSDSRLSLGKSHVDHHLKTYQLDEVTVAVTAGQAWPAATAVEATRSILDSTRAGRSVGSSLWRAAAVLGYFLKLAFDDHERRHRSDERRETEAAIVGRLTNGDPGLATVRISNEDADGVAEFSTVGAGQTAMQIVGSERFGGLLGMAFGAPGWDISDLANALWYLIQSTSSSSRLEEAPSIPLHLEGIGGGLCYGQMVREDDRFQWPLVKIGGSFYYRGLQVPDPGDDRRVWAPRIDDSRAAQLDIAHEDSRHRPASEPGRPTLRMPLRELTRGAPYRQGPEPPVLKGGWTM